MFSLFISDIEKNIICGSENIWSQFDSLNLLADGFLTELCEMVRV